MSRKYDHLPLKAYEVYERVDYGYKVQEFSYGIRAGRTPGQARARVATDFMEADNPWRGLRSRRVFGDLAERAIEREEDKGKYWRDTKAYARLQAACDAFNAAWPVGSPVECPPYANRFPAGLTFTRTPAWVPNETHILISVEGIDGGIALYSVVPLFEPAPALPIEKETKP